MNQFKKAKLRQIESGQPVESIADLQTAGIAQKIETSIEPSLEPQAASTEKKNIIEAEIEKVEIEETVEKNQLHPEPEHIAPVPVPIAVATPLEQPIIESLQSKQIQELPRTIEIEEKPIEQPLLQQKETIKTTSLPIVEQVTEPVFETITPTYHEPLISTARLVARNAATVTQPQNNVTKKNIPNIFAPKDEAKSMRKSLVLKPTSVKKAENYCSKNGGSFNELIQTLLDNFIEEYGL